MDNMPRLDGGLVRLLFVCLKTQSYSLVVRTNWFVFSIKKELVLSKSICASGVRVRLLLAASWIGRGVLA